MSQPTGTRQGCGRTPLTWLAYGLLGYYYYGYLVNSLSLALPFLRAEFNLSHTVASLHFSAFALGVVIAGLTGDRVTRRLGHGSALTLGVAAWRAEPLGLISGVMWQ